MYLPVRLICFLIILLLYQQAQKKPSQIGQKGSPFGKSLITSFLVSLAALWGWAVFWLMTRGLPLGGNQVVLTPFLLGVISLLFAGIIRKLVRKRLAQDMQGYLLVLPLLLNLALTWNFDLTTAAVQGQNWLVYTTGLLFFLICALFYFGINERLAIAPIPPLLQGLPIQVTVLFLIFLSLSFFQGVVFGKLF